MNRHALLLASAGLVLGLAAGIAAWGSRPEASPGPDELPALALTPVEAPVIGGRAPGFEAVNPGGDRFLLIEARGRIVVLNFWATWCEPCRGEMPLLETRANDHASDLQVVGVNAGEASEQVAAYGDALGVTFPLLLDPDSEVQRAYRVRGYPTTFFVNRTGVIEHVHVGSLDGETLDAYLQAMGLS